jgi:hypothetical protein
MIRNSVQDKQLKYRYDNLLLAQQTLLFVSGISSYSFKGILTSWVIQKASSEYSAILSMVEEIDSSNIPKCFPVYKC